jgi:hypothetical protein
MANINAKLNLNRTPSLVESNSLVFAKNIRLDVDKTIHRDYGVIPLSLHKVDKVTHYRRNLVRRIIYDFEEAYEAEQEANPTSALVEAYAYYIDKLKTIVNYDNSYVSNFLKGSWSIVGTIPSSREFYICIHGVLKRTVTDINGNDVELTSTADCIVCYNEETEKFTLCNCNWSYSGGEITGCVVNNLVGDKILNIGERVGDSTNTPIKCINLNKSSYTDDESLYTQTPNIPFINLNDGGTFSYTIPNGVYQFFVRYKVRDNHYTDWFPASKEFFAGNKNSMITNFGSLSYCNTSMDANKSFVFNVETLFSKYASNYQSFQIGFILSHDDTVYARAWKHFSFGTATIQFDYDANEAEEIEVTDLTKVTYQLYNVGNITSFKNKLYISNYKETNFDEDLSETASKISIAIKSKEASSGYGDYATTGVTIGTKNYISALTKDGTTTKITGANGVVNTLLTKTSTTSSYSVETAANALYANEDVTTTLMGTSAFDCYLTSSWSTLLGAKKTNESYYKKTYGDDYVGMKYNSDTVSSIIVKMGSTTLGTVSSVALALSTIYNKVKYLSENAQFVDSNGTVANSFTISLVRSAVLSYQTYEPISLDTVDGLTASKVISTDNSLDTIIDGSISSGNDTIIGSGTKVTKTRTITYTQDISITIGGYSSKINTSNIDNLISKTTLIPYQKYKFYVHFVKQTGEITNGYFVAEIECPYSDTCDKIIYPSFSSISIPSGYVACFFSIFHSAVNASTIFNIAKGENSSGGTIAYEGSCMEMNTMLEAKSSGVLVRQKTATLNGTSTDKDFTADYYYSSNAALVRYFGADGVLVFDANSGIRTGVPAFAISDYASAQDEDAELIKCTPYIKAISYDDSSDLNLCGYICQVTPLDRERCINYYSDGSTVYKKGEYETGSTEENLTYIQFKELGKYTDSEYKMSAFGMVTTEKVNVYSNYNFNYLSLTDEPKTAVKTYYNYASTESTDTESGDSNKAYSVLWRLITSLTCSDIYELASMYRSYTRKTYSIYNSNRNTTNVFENTVRSSELEGDEAEISIFRFDANDYYNVPTNRGLIVNLISVGDAILVHTQDSMFKFTGSNTLSSSEGEIQTTESQPFNTGVSEIFGSDFGFAGLQNKNHQIVTEQGYIFYDSDSKIIYMYSGQGQIIKLSDSIEKLLRHKQVLNVYFANDYYNNRFFVSIEFEDNTFVTLSYSTLEDVKSFVSLHDFYFVKAFNTKVNCYFMSTDGGDVCKIDKQRLGIYYKNDLESDYIYPSIYDSVRAECVIDTLNGQVPARYLTMKQYQSIIDIIDNSNYETIKTLNSIEWCSRFITSEFTSLINADTDQSLIKCADVIEDSQSAAGIRVYTDTTMSEKIDFGSRANDYSINNPNSYKLPRYNQGKWSLNYFRDIQNTTDTFNYMSQYNDGRNGATLRSDNNALIEGKYFVIRFFFNNEFKLETLSLNYTNKI